MTQVDAAVRPMRADDVGPAADVIQRALDDLGRRLGTPPTAAASARRHTAFGRRCRYLLATDPGGSFVHEDGAGRVAGVAQSFQRGPLWMLAFLFVTPGAQGRGVGRALLDAAMTHGRPGDGGVIVASADPQAQRRYVLAGFDLHPAVIAEGRPRRRALPPAPGVRDATAEDLDRLTGLDVVVRGAGRRDDLADALAGGARLLAVDARGWALLDGPAVRALVAVDEDAATRLLVAGLAELDASLPPGEPVHTAKLTAAQPWAVRAAVAVGLQLAARGAVMTRGWTPGGPWLPDPTLG